MQGINGHFSKHPTYVLVFCSCEHLGCPMRSGELGNILDIQDMNGWSPPSQQPLPSLHFLTSWDIMSLTQRAGVGGELLGLSKQRYS